MVTVATVSPYTAAPAVECVAEGFMAEEDFTEVEVEVMPGAADIDKGLDMRPREQQRGFMSLVLSIAAYQDML